MLNERIKTIADLKALIAKIPDDTRVYWFNGETVYNVDVTLGSVDCTEHNGKRHIATGLIFEVD